MIRKGFDILAGVADDTMRALSSCPKKRFEAGAHLMRAAEQVGHVYRITSGAAKVSRLLSTGQSITLCHLGRGTYRACPAACSG